LQRGYKSAVILKHLDDVVRAKLKDQKPTKELVHSILKESFKDSKITAGLIIKNLISCLFCEQTTRHISKRKNLKYPN
jgi:hypothetical protein